MIRWKDRNGDDLVQGGKVRVVADCFDRENQKIASQGDILKDVDMPGPDTAATVSENGDRSFDMTMGHNSSTGNLQVIPNSHIEKI